MRITSLLSILSTVALASAESIPKTDYDVIVVGGGPAGLSALSGVSRVRRTALLFDSHHYRNDVTREMHDVIGNDGTPPAEFRGLAREQISRYPTAHWSNNTVTSITPISSGDLSSFTVADNTGKNYTARKIVLGTGLRDVLPNIPGLQEAFGKGIFWCPWCDGYEHRDQSFGILGSISDVLGSVLEAHTLFSDIIAFVNGTQDAQGEAAATAQHEGWEEQLKAWNVKIDNRTIERIERLQDGATHRNRTTDTQYDKFLIHFAEGAPIERGAFITNFASVQHSTLPRQMGLNVTDNKIDVTSAMRTSESGVFAIGDANSDGSTNVPHAMFSGKRAAVYIHVEMSREESASKVSKRDELLSRRELEKEAIRAIGDNLEPQWTRARKL
ncbi:hypothetical protein N7476_003743 [Penicillium atrosanguineum]|uniref:FAD/NAD(P)-binding domain-containing protein n=1 Tax=Penicillium atrosanguineum TaxID=1132637 RepID=A0A9W9U5D9_9EURO|nr:hypothetical protein N7526_003392 [Penicillium atrosanguineum]KAJ5320741.1 hypothetical protein N7476_003743 [Penicillium atrosanguineum]